MTAKPLSYAGLNADQLADGVVGGDRALLARSITLVESQKNEHQALAKQLLQRVLPKSGNAVRLGITGVPGVGKSTTIDQLGLNLIADGHKVAVLAVDPTSKRTGGSILGDKTRMTGLAGSPDAFIRPSPTAGTLGGVTRKTRETMVLCEAAGFDVVIVETVGVGQSEVAVSDMVDFFLVLLLAGGGDDLQGIKKGIIEIADMIAINKADGDNVTRAERAASEYQGALSIFTPKDAIWFPPVITVSGQENRGLDKLWDHVQKHRATLEDKGKFAERRQDQAVAWMQDMLQDHMMARLNADPRIAERMPEIEQHVRNGTLLPTLAVDEILEMLGL